MQRHHLNCCSGRKWDVFRILEIECSEIPVISEKVLGLIKSP